ncbi:uncharacterized protein LOC115075199 [Rhinatrema bivittatum]|uniref:uncharacterized protein LOC115075199 n=1 Tax=Rhinatrema bivittatum TaxID=194408 RepID=UPI001127EB8D|nr:uncharacterized protein LOC115075199 [Rhinatrema bivittatum]XP_029431306.1 uncharacterized protein LOC115075199 [Rhinatrema bivittatum]
MASGGIEPMVWLSYFDFIPIIGSVKNSVEAIMCALKGDHKLAEDKSFLGFEGDKANLTSLGTGTLLDHLVVNGAIKTLAIIAGQVALKGGDSKVAIKAAGNATLKEAASGIKKTLGEDMVRNLGEKAAEAALKAADEPFFAAVKEAGKEVTKYASGKSTKNIGPNKQSVQKLVDEKMGFLNLFGTIDASSLEDDKSRSGRGEHVFNNDILKLFRKMIDNLIEMQYGQLTYTFERLVQEGLITRNLKIYQAYYHPLPEQYKRAIETEMVVHLPENAFYINANGMIYGKYIGYLKAMVMFYLERQFQRLVLLINRSDDVTYIQNYRRSICYMVQLINSREIYVDNVAKWYWVGGDAKKEARFQDVKSQIAQMFGRLVADDRNEISCWMTELLECTGHLFHQQNQH